MPLYEVVLKVTHDCPFCNISKKLPMLKMFLWCNDEYDVVEIISGTPEEYSTARNELAKFGKIVRETSDSQQVHIVIKTCQCNVENSVGQNIDAFNLLHVSPVVYEQGWEYYRIVAFRHRDLKGFLQRLEDRGFVFDVLRKVPFDGFIASSLALTADALFSDLTEKQMDALMTAYSHGYYRLPRKADVQTIASQRRLPRTTFQEHLKKAENKLIVSLIPYIQLFKQTPEEKRKSLRIK